MSSGRWFRDGGAWRLIARGYLPWLGALMLAWEIAHARLYTLWREAEPGYIAFSILHCTLGDVVIGGFALLLSLVVVRAGALASWRWRRIALLTVLFGAGYTMLSEWVNIAILRSWTYADSMPKLGFGSFQLGVTPLAQWLVAPPLALYLAWRRR